MLMGAKFDAYNEQKKLSLNKDAPQFRGCLPIQNRNKKKHGQYVISKNKHPISRNIQLWDNLFIGGRLGLREGGTEHMLGHLFNIQ